MSNVTSGKGDKTTYESSILASLLVWSPRIFLFTFIYNLILNQAWW